MDLAFDLRQDDVTHLSVKFGRRLAEFVGSAFLPLSSVQLF